MKLAILSIALVAIAAGIVMGANLPRKQQAVVQPEPTIEYVYVTIERQPLEYYMEGEAKEITESQALEIIRMARYQHLYFIAERLDDYPDQHAVWIVRYDQLREYILR